jgi:hypothetical protein
MARISQIKFRIIYPMGALILKELMYIVVTSNAFMSIMEKELIGHFTKKYGSPF